MTPTVQLYYFGRFNIQYQAGQKLEQLPKPPTKKSQSLLAYLVRHRQRPQPRERLMAMFWGERPEQRARRSLSTALWHIRRCFLNDNPIQGGVHAVYFQFPGNVYLDVEEFETGVQKDDLTSLQAAVALYQGEFLAGFYDDWIVSERYRLQSLYEEALARMMILCERLGQYPAALQTAQRLLEADTLREDAHRLVMRVYGRLGRRNAALEQYQRCQEIVRRELGAEPMAETAELYQVIRDGRFEIGPVDDTLDLATVLAAATVRAGQSPLDANLPDTLIGRDSELDLLQAYWHNSLARRPKLLLISGEAGVGKTQLVKGFATQLQQEGIRILWGRCYEFERLLPYQPIAEALRPVLVTLARQELRQLPAWVVVALAHLVPEVMEHYEPDPADEVIESTQAALAEAGQEQAHLFHAIVHFLMALASKAPVLLVLDDLHWATASTLALLHYLVRQLDDQAMMLLGTYRREAVGSQHPLQGWQQQLRQAGIARRLHLQRLPLSAVEAWIIEMSGAGEAVVPLARRLYEETEGNPFFVAEMIKALFEVGAIGLAGAAWHGRFDQVSRQQLPLPRTVRDVIQSRVLRLSPDAQEALRLAAVLGREFDFDLLNAVWQRREEATLAALDDLLRARLIDEGTGTIGRDYAFTHYKIQEVVYATIPRRRRQQYHAQTAATIEILYADQFNAWLNELAFHYEQGQKINKEVRHKAVTYLRRAGEQAAAQFALGEAAGYFSRALALASPGATAERYRLLMAREQMYDWQAEREAQAQDLAALAQLVADHSEDAQPAWEIELALRQVNYAEATGDYQAGAAAAEKAIQLAKASQAIKPEATGYLKWGQILYRQGAYESAQAQLARVLVLSQSNALPEIEASARQALALARWALGDYNQATTYARDALALFVESGNRRNEGVTLMTLGNIHQYRSDHEQARTYFEQSLHTFRQIGDRRHESTALNNLGVVAEGQSDYKAAMTYHKQCLAISRQIGDRRLESLSQYNLGVVALELGDYVSARNYHQECLATSREVGYRRGEAAAHRELGRGAVEQGNFATASGDLSQALSIYRGLGDQRGEGLTLVFLSRYLTRLGDYKPAATHAREALSLLREIGSQAGESLSLVALGLVDCERGRYKTALDFGQQALQIAQAVNSRGMQGSSLTLSGDALAGLGRLNEADEAYRQAITLWEDTGQAHLSAVALAGRAAVALAQGEPAQALIFLEGIWPRLIAGNLKGADSPGRIYLTCYRVLLAAHDARTQVVLGQANELLQTQAATIGEARQRRAFLENVSAHRDIVAIFSATESD